MNPYDNDEICPIIPEPVPCDDPNLDCTDWAHPAWWRGYDYASDTLIESINALLDSDAPPRRCGYRNWNALLQRLATLRDIVRGLP